MTGRAVGFAALGAFGLLHWMAMIDPGAPLRAAAALAVAMVAAVRPVVLIVALPAVLLIAGVPPGDLPPWNWDLLGQSLAAGIEGVGGARIPYAGSDPDVRLVIVLGGALMIVSAGQLARQSRAAGLVSLGFLYGIPAVAVDFGAEFLRGALLAVLVLAYLRLERLHLRDLVPAAALAVTGCVVALAAAPALDAEEPWFDYEDFAIEQAAARAVEFSWEHDYGGIVWPRDGREVLQVDSPRRAYWKAETLDRFDGMRWTRDLGAGAIQGIEMAGVSDEAARRWSFDIAVAVRALESETIPLAGTTRAVDMDGLDPELEAAGIWEAERDLHRGDSYRASVYVPDPTGPELAAAAPVYPSPIVESLVFNAVDEGGLVPLTVPEFAGTPMDGYRNRDPRALDGTNLRRTWALSRELMRGADTPYEYVRAVRGHFSEGFDYDETPPRGAATLEGFLFESRAGFCQHYSGAMALLLRMGGVPARVATGFAPGSYDERKQRYVVRDLDAHSWVEAWFGGIGWVTFDPTPAAAPPRSQALPGSITAGVGDALDRGTTQGLPPAPEEGGSGPLLLIAIVLATSGIAAIWVRRPRRVKGSELERALRGAGVPFAPETTLLALERDLGPGAAGYLRAVRTERYAGGPGPTAGERRGLRRTLSEGRGPLARLRTWAALH